MLNKNFLKWKTLLFLAGLTVILLASCKKEQQSDTPAETYNPTPYELTIPEGFPDMQIPADNPMTVEGVDLGRKLFYDQGLSGDNTLACATCHSPEFSFSDNSKRFSVGIDGIEGTRNAPAVINPGWLPALFWDGREPDLEGQALEPVPNPIEMHQSWSETASKLNADPEYQDLFFKAFGTRNIDSTLVTKAIAQFERTMISSNSKWDRYLRGEAQLSQAESKGFELFFTEKGDCFHCHTTILFTDNHFHNNGMDTEFADSGLYEVTGNPGDIGKFKTPTLRNLEFTAPYMHDGRFSTLEEVIDFYSSGVQWSPTIDPLMKKVGQGGVQLTDEEKEYLIAYLNTLTDTTYINNPDYADPSQ